MVSNLRTFEPSNLRTLYPRIYVSYQVCHVPFEDFDSPIESNDVIGLNEQRVFHVEERVGQFRFCRLFFAPTLREIALPRWNFLRRRICVRIFIRRESELRI